MNSLISSFSNCKIRVPISEERDSLLSLASVAEIKPLIPAIDMDANFDLLPIAFDSCVANKFNKNNDGIDGQTAVAIAKNFIYKPINIEHKQENIAGVILSANFTAIDSHRVLTEVEASQNEIPFYITLGGVIWKNIKPSLAEYIEECADPSSPNYEKISASWELGFQEYVIALRSDSSRLLKGSELVTEQEQIDKIEKLSKAGKYEGKKIFRLLTAGVTPIGIGLTENPAADVKGVACETEVINDNSTSNAKIVEKNENNISLNIKADVIVNEEVKIMNLLSLDEIKDDALKAGTITASVIKDFYMKKIEEACSEHVKNKEEADKAKEATKASLDNLLKEHEDLKKTSAEIKLELENLQKAIALEVAQKNFNTRMEYFDTKFELTVDSKKVIAADLNGIESDEQFKAYVEKMQTLLVVKEEKKTAPAVVIASEATPEKAVEKAIDNATPVSASVPNSTNTAPDSLTNKYKGAFQLTDFKIQVGRNSRKK